MKKSKLIVKFRFLVLLLLLGGSQIGCSKDSLVLNTNIDNELDSVLHRDSKYIAVFGDIQSYTSSKYLSYYKKSLDWITAHSDNICFILHTGDVTEHNWISEWETFHNTTAPYSETVPFYTCAGNHDYRCNAPNQRFHRDSTYFNQYVGFPSTLSRIVASYDSTKFENILVREKLFDNDPIYLLILELEPRTNVIQWADSLIKSYPNENIILIVHSFIYYETSYRYQKLQYMGSGSHSAQYVWDNLVYPNNNIRCVLCGHTRARSCVLYSTNAAGREIPQIMFNIQWEPKGGNGLIELWEFDRSDNVNVRTYNTHLEKFVSDTLSDFHFKYR